jgi:hypothetical protein
MLVPGVAEGGGGLDADLAGTRRLSGATVIFNQAAGNSMRGFPFAVEPSRLRAPGAFGEEAVREALDQLVNLAKS